MLRRKRLGDSSLGSVFRTDVLFPYNCLLPDKVSTSRLIRGTYNPALCHLLLLQQNVSWTREENMQQVQRERSIFILQESWRPKENFQEVFSLTFLSRFLWWSNFSVFAMKLPSGYLFQTEGPVVINEMLIRHYIENMEIESVYF